ncbi:GlxA family transcriptional regulator [Azospirillum canadense]|uniref:GlxA family transcriptional regulator n=1 Tax=Azospirillum canadense TaxID=403962 RepID=UPI0022263D4A|nr:GlxA family transcriptional regulator [Azospirillum canadense]MCW2238147.1 transcriptional regulator GlxA family with amidase domain [Azospirillum canadense]
MMSKPKLVAQKLVAMLAYDGVNLIDVSGPLQTFQTAGRLAREAGLPPPYELRTVSVAGGGVTTGPGLPILTEPLESLDGQPVDTLLVPGGSRNGQPMEEPELVAWLRRRGPEVRRPCSVCTGAFLLADAGLLDGRRATTHWDWADRLSARHPAVTVDPDPIFIKDGPVWTSAGVTAGIDLALALVEADLGHALAIATARQLVMFMKRPGGQSQFSVPLSAQCRSDGAFRDLHAWIAAHLHEDLRIERLAEQAGMSPRTFARLYVAKVGRTPAKTVQAMRLEAACNALERTGAPLKRIAADTGFGDEQTLRRVFQKQYGINPVDYRARFSLHAELA